MLWLIDSFAAIRDFMGLGGPVLVAIAITIFIMWVLIIERIMYFRSTMRQLNRDIRDRWESRSERDWAPHSAR